MRGGIKCTFSFCKICIRIVLKYIKMFIIYSHFLNMIPRQEPTPSVIFNMTRWQRSRWSNRLFSFSLLHVTLPEKAALLWKTSTTFVAWLHSMSRTVMSKSAPELHHEAGATWSWTSAALSSSFMFVFAFNPTSACSWTKQTCRFRRALAETFNKEKATTGNFRDGIW